MSYVSVGGVKNLQGLVSYIYYGNKLGAAKRRKEDDRRAVVSFCTMPITDFIDRGNAIKIGKGLKYGAISLVQSFNNKKDRLDYKSKADQQYVNDLGYELAHKLFPHSEIFVGTHIDGKNHMLHNHIIVLNYDPTTGKALTNERLYKIRNKNDELMKEHGLSIIPKKPRQPVLTTYMTKRNLEKHGKDWVEKFDFDTALQRKLNAVLALKPSNLREYEHLAQTLGITVKQHEFGRKKKVIGLLYRMDDLVIKKGDLKPRERRRKASLIGARYTTIGLDKFFKEVQKQPSDFTPKEKDILLQAKYGTAENPAQEKTLNDTKLQAKHIIETHKKPDKQPEPQQQVTEPVTQNAALTASERAQVQQQRNLFVQEELAKIKKEREKKIAELKQKYRDEANAIEADRSKQDIKNWDLKTAGDISSDEYNRRFINLADTAEKQRNKALSIRDKNIQSIRADYAKKLKEAPKALKAQAEKEITKPDPNFDAKTTKKETHKNYLEKSLSSEKAKKKQRKQNKKRKQVQKQKKDLDADCIDDEIEGIRGVATDGGIIPVDAFDTDLNDEELNQFVTNFDDVNAVNNSTKPPKQPTTPKPKKQKSQVNDDYSLQEQALHEAKLDKNPEEYGVNDDLQY